MRARQSSAAATSRGSLSNRLAEYRCMLTATTGRFVSALAVDRPAGALFVCGEERLDLAAECDSKSELRDAPRLADAVLEVVDRSRAELCPSCQPFATEATV
jgi:hypothetical protein